MEKTLETRALNAFFRLPMREVGLAFVNPLAPGVTRRVELNGLAYVLVSSSDARIVAVFRVLRGGGLKRLRRWPKDIDA